MKKLKTIIANDIITTLKSKSYLFTLIGLPVLLVAIVLIVSAVSKNAGGSGQVGQMPGASSGPKAAAILDESGLIKSIPADVSAQAVLYTDEQAARKDTEEKKLSGFYVFHSDFLQTGNIDYYTVENMPSFGDPNPGFLNRIVEANLIQASPELADRIANPMKMETVLPPSQAESAPRGELAYFLPYAITMLYYILLIMVSTTMFNSVTKEKENRVMEILLTSVSPTELLTGKIIARGFTGLLQVIAWLAGGALLLKLGARTLPIPANASIPPSLFFWGIIYFLLGYAIYASLMAGLGAMVPNLREGSQTTIAVIFPLIVPMFFMNNLIVAPNSPISMFLGFFPLTAPVAMMTRIASGQTPLWQIVLSALIMAATAYLIVKAAAGLFRAQYLLSSGSFKPGKFYKALIGR